MSPSRVHEEVGEFLARILRPGEIVIGLLRYGAHLPHIAQRTARLPVAEIPMILSHLLEFFPPSFFVGKRFLVLDDSTYRGASMARAFARLKACGVPEERIRTAAVVAHEQCDPASLPNEYEACLRDADYIEWKEELTEAVRFEVRPTERDHPLYYFSGSELAPPILMEAGNVLGAVHSIESPSQDMLKFTVAFDRSSVADVDVPGATFPAACKIRFYCERVDTGEWLITAVPIVPTVIDVTTALADGGVRAARALGLPEAFFRELSQRPVVGETFGLIYFLLNRGLASVLLERFLVHVSHHFQNTHRLIASRPELRDGVVKYVFPQAYSAVFHPAAYQRLDHALGTACAGGHIPETLRAMPGMPDTSSASHLLSQYAQVLAPLVRKGDPVTWVGNSWEPVTSTMPRITYTELMQEFKDQRFLSAALDELLDDGLLRAADLCLDKPAGIYGRVFMPGGEYRALEVHRLGRTSIVTADVESELYIEDLEGEGSAD